MDNRNTAAVYKFKARFPRLNESTGREFKKKKENREVSELIPKYLFRNWSTTVTR